MSDVSVLVPTSASGKLFVESCVYKPTPIEVTPIGVEQYEFIVSTVPLNSGVP